MAENEQDARAKKANAMPPPEFQRFQEQMRQILTEDSPTVDKNIAKWTRVLEVWKKLLSNSPYQEQATTLLRPLLTNCSVFYLQRYKESKQRADLDQSIKLARELVQTLKDGAPDITGHIEHLGFGLTLRYGQTHSTEDLAELTTAWQRAIANAGDAVTRAKYFYALGEVCKEKSRASHSSRGNDSLKPSRLST